MDHEDVLINYKNADDVKELLQDPDAPEKSLPLTPRLIFPHGDKLEALHVFQVPAVAKVRMLSVPSAYSIHQAYLNITDCFFVDAQVTLVRS